MKKVRTHLCQKPGIAICFSPLAQYIYQKYEG